MYNVKELYEKLDACTDDGQRLDILFDIATGLLNFDEKRVLEIAGEIKELALRIDSPQGLSYYHATKGRVFFKRSQYAECEKEFLLSLEQSLLTPHLMSQAMCYDSIGILYSFQYRNQEALEACYKALSIYGQLDINTQGVPKFMAVCYNNIGAAYKQIYELDKAEDSYLQGLALANVYDNRIRLSLLNNLANIKIQQHKYDEGIEHATKALAGFREQKHKNGEANAMVIIAHCQLGKGMYAVAMAQYLAVFKLLKEIDYKTVEIGALWGMGNVYLKMEAFEEAVKHYHKALDIALAIGDDYEACYVYNLLAKAYQILNQTDAANQVIDAAIVIAEKRNFGPYLAELKGKRQLA